MNYNELNWCSINKEKGTRTVYISVEDKLGYIIDLRIMRLYIFHDDDINFEYFSNFNLDNIIRDSEYIEDCEIIISEDKKIYIETNNSSDYGIWQYIRTDITRNGFPTDIECRYSLQLNINPKEVDFSKIEDYLLTYATLTGDNISSLYGLPSHIDFDLNIVKTSIESLDGLPSEINGDLTIEENPNLEGYSIEYDFDISDICDISGDFYSDNVNGPKDE